MRFSKNLLKLLPKELKGALWQDQISLEALLKFRAAAPYDFSAQYMQEPTPSTDGVFKESYFRFFDCPTEIPEIETIGIFLDTAQKVQEHNDFTVMQAWAKAGNSIYLMDQVRGKFEAPQLYTETINFFNKWKSCWQNPHFAKEIHIEDASSGSSLIQQLRHDTNILIVPIKRIINKGVRIQGCVNYFAQGKVYFKRAHFTDDLLHEFRSYKRDNSHKHDDQIDPCVDAVETLLVNNMTIYREGLI